jgi:hypothetical protein
MKASFPITHTLQFMEANDLQASFQRPLPDNPIYQQRLEEEAAEAEEEEGPGGPSSNPCS